MLEYLTRRRLSTNDPKISETSHLGAIAEGVQAPRLNWVAANAPYKA